MDGLASFCVECGLRELPLLRTWGVWVGPKPRPLTERPGLPEKRQRAMCWPDGSEESRSLKRNSDFSG